MKILISHSNEIPLCPELETHVPLHVEGEVVRPAEGALAQLALEGPVTRVLALVPRQLVRPREPPPAALTVRNIRHIYISTYLDKSYNDKIISSYLRYIYIIIFSIYLPVAHVRLFTGVGTPVRLQVRGLGVGLAAVAVLASVDNHLNILWSVANIFHK